MNDFKIYRDGKYDTKENLKLKAKDKLAEVSGRLWHAIEVVDDYFVNH